MSLLALTCTTATLHTLAQYIAAERGDTCLPNGTCTASLPDVLHELTEQPGVKKRWAALSECILLTALLLAASQQRVKHVLLLCNFAFILRSLCMMVTSLPDASQCCVVRLGVDSSGKTGSCHDLMFSGHMTVTTIALLVAVRTNPSLLPVVLPLLLTQTFAIPLSHNHYTIDVVIALLVALLLTLVVPPPTHVYMHNLSMRQRKA